MFPITCGITFAFGGISTNTKAEALDEQNNAIAGLFVAGEMVGDCFIIITLRIWFNVWLSFW